MINKRDQTKLVKNNFEYLNTLFNQNLNILTLKSISRWLLWVNKDVELLIKLKEGEKHE